MGFAADSSGQISRERMLELEAFVADNKASIGRFMGRHGQDLRPMLSAWCSARGRRPAAGPSRLLQRPR